MSEPRSTKVDCRDCAHFRSAPHQAREDGCYFPGNMPSKQSATYLDEQQEAGNHVKINLRGDCPDFERKPAKVTFLQRLLGA